MQIVFACHQCNARLSAEDSQSGQLARCPGCQAVVRVPEAVASAAGQPQQVAVTPGQAAFTPPPGFGTRLATGRRYGFNCVYCSSRLEANEAMAAQEGQCPTCGNNITIPILDRYGRLIDPKTREVIKQAPHPVHAYAAAGDRAPQIRRMDDGSRIIICPRCRSSSPITANNCRSCAMPFTMEGTTVDASGNSNGFCVASLVLGILGLPAACLIIVPLLAVVFGVIGLMQVGNRAESSGRGMAIAGLIMGVLGLLGGIMMIGTF